MLKLAFACAKLSLVTGGFLVVFTGLHFVALEYLVPKPQIEVNISDLEVMTKDKQVLIIIDDEGSNRIIGTGRQYDVFPDDVFSWFTNTDIDINTNSTVNIGVDASFVHLAGGEGGGVSRHTHKHNYAHVHKTGNMGIPIPPQDHVGLTIETDATLDNTTRTKAD